MSSDLELKWKNGYGVISRSEETQSRFTKLLENNLEDSRLHTADIALDLISAADKLANAAMWVVAHMTYASRVDLTGDELPITAFKKSPEGHMGGSLNVAIAFVGYLLANALTGHTRAWTLGQGHCVAAIEAINTLIGDVSPDQQGRYDRSQIGLSRLAQDFYSYAITADGRPAAPLGGHVGPHTAGGILEGGYLGFAGLQYVHMPLPGERLVAFLSDGAFEEQRGSDWSPRWWRAEDSGLAVPVMVLNGRRIEQRTEIGQEGGSKWMEAHLRLSGFEPITIDGHDPLAYAWAIIEAETRLERFSNQQHKYPAPLPYIIAKCTKGFGFPGAGTNNSHNLPLNGNPRFDKTARRAFHEGARALFVPNNELEDAVAVLDVHERQERQRESRNPLANRTIDTPQIPEPKWLDPKSSEVRCAMAAIDEQFISIVKANPHLRPRVGNPDELRSNHMVRTLETLKHRVNEPECGSPEAVTGGVITALNEEAVISAVLGNKGGINLAVSYEAFAMKMLGALRQDIIFARHLKEVGRAAGWLSVALIITSHTWENSKNEQSHQDPTLPEALLGEMSDTARVFFPIDANSASEALNTVYRSHGQIACLVTPKRVTPVLLTAKQVKKGFLDGAISIRNNLPQAEIQIVAIGAYQTHQALQAYDRLSENNVGACVTVILEPGRFRKPRDEIETQYVASDQLADDLFPPTLPRIILSHTRPEPILGILRRIDGGPKSTRALGYIGRGGTLDVFGMLFANKCTWAHVIDEVADLLKIDSSGLLSKAERQAIDLQGDPQILNIQSHQRKSHDLNPN